MLRMPVREPAFERQNGGMIMFTVNLLNVPQMNRMMAEDVFVSALRNPENHLKNNLAKARKLNKTENGWSAAMMIFRNAVR